MKKYRVLKWVNKNIARTEIGKVPPKWINFLRKVFYPFQVSYEKQSGIRYNFERDIYIIEGIEFSRQFFQTLSFLANNGEITCIKDNTGIIKVKIDNS